MLIFQGVATAILGEKNNHHPWLEFPRWKSWSCKDALWTVLLWVFLVAARWAPMLWKVHVQEIEVEVDAKCLQKIFGHTFLVGVLLVASFWQVRTSHAMLLILNSWSASLLRGEITCIEAKRLWRLGKTAVNGCTVIWNYQEIGLKKSWPPNNDQLFFLEFFYGRAMAIYFVTIKMVRKDLNCFFFANQQLFGNSSPHPASCLSTSRRRVSGLFRKTSRTFEHCFAALASLIVILALTALYDLLQGAGWKYWKIGIEKFWA